MRTPIAHPQQCTTPPSTPGIPRPAVLLAGLLTSLTPALTGCATTHHTPPPSAVAVRINNTTITTTQIQHWMNILAAEHYVPDAPSFQGCVRRRETLEPEAVKSALQQECRSSYQAIKQHALDYLITSHWLTGEANEEGLHTTKQEIQQHLQTNPTPPILNGAGTPADKQLNAETELAQTKLNQHQTSKQPPITQTQTNHYYKQHLARYEHTEQREIYIVEHVPTASLARKIRGEVVSGRTEMAKVGLRELVVDRHPMDGVPGKLALATAIFAAPPRALSGLLLFDRLYAFFEVTHITSAFVQPLAQVAGGIRRLLAAAQRKRALALFVSGSQRKWAARTDCLPGYVVQKCHNEPDRE